MKKLLIATAALAMVAGTAQAQSSVTVYGVLDIAMEQVKSQTNAGVSSEATTQKGSNNNATSVIGLKGTEDLGGGLKAMFELQGNLNTNTGAVGTTVTADAVSTTFFDRQSWVGLSDAKLGTIKLGRTSDVLDSVEGFANFTQFFDTETASANGLGNKNANTVRYDSPNIAGVTFAASYSSDATAAGATSASTTNHTNVTYGIQYVQGNLTIGAANGRANVSDSTVEGELDTYYAGYDFGIANVRVQQTKNKAVTSTTTNFVEFKTTELSAAFPMPMLGKGVTLVAHYEEAEHSTQAGRVAAEKDYKQMGLFVKKDLSKRTAIYAGYRDKNVDGTAAGIDTKTFATGVTHAF